MKVAVEDLRRVIAQARRHGREVVLGGHSLGASIATAYATWDFNGRAGAKDLSGLVLVDGGSGPTTLTAEEATQRLAALATGSPWLSFGGIPSPFAGLFNIVGSTFAQLAPDERSTLQRLAAAAGEPEAAGAPPPARRATATRSTPRRRRRTSPRRRSTPAASRPRAIRARGIRAGEITPIQRVADMFHGTGLIGLDGTAWYHPQRLTIDSGAVNAGIANPAQAVLDVNATHGDDLRKLPIYAFGAALGGQRVLDAAQLLATQSQIPQRKLTLVDASATYAHVDPLSAYPDNDFVDHLQPFLKKTADDDRDRHHHGRKHRKHRKKWKHRGHHKHRGDRGDRRR